MSQDMKMDIKSEKSIKMEEKEFSYSQNHGTGNKGVALAPAHPPSDSDAMDESEFLIKAVQRQQQQDLDIHANLCGANVNNGNFFGNGNDMDPNIHRIGYANGNGMDANINRIGYANGNGMDANINRFGCANGNGGNYLHGYGGNYANRNELGMQAVNQRNGHSVYQDNLQPVYQDQPMYQNNMLNGQMANQFYNADNLMQNPNLSLMIPTIPNREGIQTPSSIESSRTIFINNEPVERHNWVFRYD